MGGLGLVKALVLLLLLPFFVFFSAAAIATVDSSQISSDDALRRIAHEREGPVVEAPTKVVPSSQRKGEDLFRKALLLIEEEPARNGFASHPPRVSVSTVAMLTLAMAAATGLGSIPFFFMDLKAQWAGICNGIAAGVMLSASFDLVQEGQKYGDGTWVVLGVIAGGFFILCCQKVSATYPCFLGHRIVCSFCFVHICMCMSVHESRDIIVLAGGVCAYAMIVFWRRCTYMMSSN
jgi:hypothetical protein